MSRTMFSSSGPTPSRRRQRAAEHMIAAAKRAGAFERPQIGEILDDADCGRVALGITADRARVGSIEITAARTRPDRHRSGRHCRRERLHHLFAALYQKQRRPARRTRAEPGELGEQLDQCVEFRHWQRERLTSRRARGPDTRSELSGHSTGIGTGPAMRPTPRVQRFYRRSGASDGLPCCAALPQRRLLRRDGHALGLGPAGRRLPRDPEAGGVGREVSGPRLGLQVLGTI